MSDTIRDLRQASYRVGFWLGWQYGRIHALPDLSENSEENLHQLAKIADAMLAKAEGKSASRSSETASP